MVGNNHFFKNFQRKSLESQVAEKVKKLGETNKDSLEVTQLIIKPDDTLVNQNEEKKDIVLEKKTLSEQDKSSIMHTQITKARKSKKMKQKEKK